MQKLENSWKSRFKPEMSHIEQLGIMVYANQCLRELNGYFEGDRDVPIYVQSDNMISTSHGDYAQFGHSTGDEPTFYHEGTKYVIDHYALTNGHVLVAVATIEDDENEEHHYFEMGR